MKLFNQARVYGAKLAAATGALVLGSSAFAQTTDPVTSMFAAISLTTVAASVLAIGIVIVGIAMAFKAIDLSKRGVKKV